MNRLKLIPGLLLMLSILSCKSQNESEDSKDHSRKTVVTIKGENFYINGKILHAHQKLLHDPM